MKRTTKTATTQAEGMFVPFQVVPLRVWACWRTGDWSELDEAKVRFGFNEDSQTVTLNPVESKDEYRRRNLGPLPPGWACECVTHYTSNDDEFYVGPKETIDRLKALADSRDEAEHEIDKIIHCTLG